MSLPLTDDLGVVYVTTSGTPVYWNNGLGYADTGALCVTTTVSASDAYIGGKRRDAVGRLVVADATVGGRPWNYNAGWPSDKNTGATIRQINQVPAATDPRVAGIAIGPRGGVYMTTASVPGTWSPADLFANGEPGFWYDPSDLSTMWQDSAGTIPMQPVGTVADQPVGKILDKSGNGNHASQATSTARPVLSARVNLLTKTEDFADAVWSKFSSSATGNAAAAPDGTNTASLLAEDSANTEHYVSQQCEKATTRLPFSYSVYFKKATGTRNFAVAVTDGLTGGFGAIFSTSGAVVQSSFSIGDVANWTFVSSVISPVGDGWYLATISATTNTLYRVDGVCYLVDGVNTYYQGDGTSGIYVWGAQLDAGIAPQTYQRVNTDSDYNASGFPLYLKFDGVDDSLATASFAMTSTSKATVFAGYANGKTGSTGTLLEFSANYMNNNGSMALLVPSLSTSNVSFGSRGTLGAGEKDAPTAPAGGLEKRVLTAYQDFATLNDYGCDYIRANGIPLQNLNGVGNSDVGAGPFGTYPAYIGARAGTANFMNGHIYSLTLAGNGYDAQTLENMENWIDGKLHP